MKPNHDVANFDPIGAGHAELYQVHHHHSASNQTGSDRSKICEMHCPSANESVGEQALKEDERVKAERRADTTLKYQEWENGKGGEQKVRLTQD